MTDSDNEAIVDVRQVFRRDEFDALAMTRVTPEAQAKL